MQPSCCLAREFERFTVAQCYDPMLQGYRNNWLKQTVVSVLLGNDWCLVVTSWKVIVLDYEEKADPLQTRHEQSA